jgi:3-hydroxyisobutyrate dehydrogenase-like beta-hydroxyacid dehydrogenase
MKAAAAQMGVETAARWLIVGHGSVGSALVRRLDRRGVRPSTFDPSPRVPVLLAEHLTAIDSAKDAFDIVISCVAPAAAEQALEAVRPLLKPTSLYLEWNTVPPEIKRVIASAAPCTVVDVGLIDTLDDEAANPSVAVSGSEAGKAAALLAELGFHVDVVGAECGDAALLKLARSLFMKSLEALVIEFEAAIAPLAGRDVIVGSIERNLGERFTGFATMLIETDRIHATRRCRELEGAIAAFRPAHCSLRVAEASVDVLRAAAAAWRAPHAPDERAGAREFAHFLASELQTGNA